MNLIHWLFSKSNQYNNLITYITVVIGTIELVSTAINHFIWSVSVKRQTSRMNIRLFKSLLQRVSNLFVSPSQM
jgi:hypothetical protein